MEYEDRIETNVVGGGEDNEEKRKREGYVGAKCRSVAKWQLILARRVAKWTTGACLYLYLSVFRV